MSLLTWLLLLLWLLSSSRRYDVTDSFQEKGKNLYKATKRGGSHVSVQLQAVGAMWTAGRVCFSSRAFPIEKEVHSQRFTDDQYLWPNALFVSLCQLQVER